MKTIARLFADDVRRLGNNVVTVIIVVGLVLLPSIFSWYNIIACWDVFGNTGNLTVAVANQDKGYTSELLPLKVTIGDQITSALRENDQLNWVFTDADDAVDGVRAGRYYAAVVIPESFSRDMLSFYSDDMQHAEITYYSNQKKSAIAPKVTDQGADQVAAQVNKVFAETVSEVALGISQALLDSVDAADADGRIGQIAGHIGQVADRIDETSTVLSSYSAIIGSAQVLVSDTAAVLDQTRQASDEIGVSAQSAQAATRSALTALGQAADSLMGALDDTQEDIDEVDASVNRSFSRADAACADAVRELDASAAILDASGLAQAADSLRAGADSIEQANASVQAAHGAVQAHVQTARQAAQKARDAYTGEFLPALSTLRAAVDEANAQIAEVAQRIDDASDSLTGDIASVSGRLAETRENLDSTVARLDEGADRLRTLTTDLSEALATGDGDRLRQIIGSDPEALASVLAAPIEIDRHAVFPVETFGSAMSPLYTTLALWIGALLLMVTLRVIPSERTLARLGNPTIREVFIGRFGIIALITLMQATLLSVGNLVFLGVQAVHPVLYVLCFWVAGLVFSFIIYTLVSLFANLGKALSVVLLIVQVAGGGGSFPLQLLPPFFQAMSPYLPIAHAVRAMRAAMFGLYGMDYWIELGILLLFVVPMVILGVVLRYPLSHIVPKFVAEVEKSELM